MTIKGWVKWAQSKLGFINRLPSWLNEGLGGFALVVLLSLVFHGGLPLFLGLLLSECYERFLDPWGYNPEDVQQRVNGLLVGQLVLYAFHYHMR